MRSRIHHLAVSDFRSYERAAVDLAGRSAYLTGPNGAGKTNLLEAVSLFSPGRGLRGAALTELGRRLPGEAAGRLWAVSARVESDGGEIRVGTGVDGAGTARRLVRVDGETMPAAALTALLRPIWLTPAQDRLFLDSATERRRFFDRLVFAATPGHAAQVSGYERAQRERMRLLIMGPSDPAWLDALEALAATAGARVAAARAETLAALSAEVDARADRPFPSAALALSGASEQLAMDGATLAEIEARLRAGLASGRERDTAAGRALTGPHRGDLVVVCRENDRRTKGADSEPDFSPGGAPFPCHFAAESCIVAG